jgi:hypothetical protein
VSRTFNACRSGLSRTLLDEPPDVGVYPLRAEPQHEPPLPDAAVAGERNRDALAVPYADALLGRQRDAEEPVHLRGVAEVIDVDGSFVAHLEREVEWVGRRRTRPREEAHRGRA